MFRFGSRRGSRPSPTAAPAADITESRAAVRAARPLGRPQLRDASVARWIAMALAGVCGVIIAWRLREVELLLFGAILFGVFFSAVAEPIHKRLHLGPGWSLAAAVLLFGVVLLGSLLFFGVRLEAQLQDLTQSLPPAWSRFRSSAGATPLGALLVHALDRMTRQASGDLVPHLRGYAVTTGAALLGLLLMVVAGAYLAARPGRYRRGALRLIPVRRRAEVEQFFDVTGGLLRRWLLAEAAAMVTVGVLTGLALWAIGVPTAGALGVLAAIGEFVPMVGVFVASAPALLLAATHGWSTVIWTVVLLTAIHQFDGNILQPFLQRGFNSVPAVVTLFALVGFGAFLGLLGLVFAIPLTLVCLGAAHVWLRDDEDDDQTSASI